MERIYTLIDKLYQQKQQNASPAHLLFTVQLLQTELSKLQNKNGSLGTAKVAVTLPMNLSFAEDVVRSAMADINFDEHRENEQPQIKVEEPPVVLEKKYFIPKPILSKAPVEEVASVIHPDPKKTQRQHVLNPAFDAVSETSDYAQYLPKKETKEDKTNKEVHELISVQKESLNDRLKEEKKELSHIFIATPIKDLRKAIGINDRFTLVRELFRGDEAAYERSIKTINNFNILSEAEYWINRELKYKLGWHDQNETVQHFYQLVKRRFS